MKAFRLTTRSPLTLVPLSLLTASALTLLPIPPAASADKAQCTANEGGTAIYCETSAPAVLEVSAVSWTTASSSNSSGSSQSSVRYVPYNRLSTGPDGKPCATTGYVREGVVPPDERLLIDPNPLETNIPVTGNDLRVLENYPLCPESPRVPGQPVLPETRSMAAARYWERIPLPTPDPRIAPGRAITGKLAYLETHGETARIYTDDTAFGPLYINAAGTYTVDWGDGEITGPYGFEGGIWPDGKITHNYLKIGFYNIVVREKWTATWSLDGENGVLRTLETTGSIANFPVEQIQAVVQR